MSKYLGIDLERNKIGVWNLGIVVFEKDRIVPYNIFIMDNFSEDAAFNYGDEYTKRKTDLYKCMNPIFVQTTTMADLLVTEILRGNKFRFTFGYNSKEFDLPIIKEVFPRLYALIENTRHIDLMPFVVEYIVPRKDYYEFFRKAVERGHVKEGNPTFAKYNAELVTNYILAKTHSVDFPSKWKKEEHVGVEDLIDFEHVILKYYRKLKKKMPSGTKRFVRWPHL